MGEEFAGINLGRVAELRHARSPRTSSRISWMSAQVRWATSWGSPTSSSARPAIVGMSAPGMSACSPSHVSARSATGPARSSLRTIRREPRRDQGDVAVLRRCCDGHIRVTRVEVDRLSANKHETVPMLLERVQRIKQHPSRSDGDRRVAHRPRHSRSFALIQSISALPSSGFRPGPAKRSTATCDGAASRSPSRSTSRSNT
jgi:hypothetical protein